MKLEEHKGRGIEGYNKKCRLCGEEDEDLIHFISKCKKLEQIRDYNLLNGDISDPEERMRTLLYRDERSWRVGKLIRDLWDLRSKLLKEIEKPKIGRNKGLKHPVITTQGCISNRPKRITQKK